MGAGSYTSRKRRRARARALPQAAVAKPGGANTTAQIIFLKVILPILIHKTYIKCLIYSR